MGGNGKENKQGASQQRNVTHSATLTITATLNVSVRDRISRLRAQKPWRGVKLRIYIQI